MKCIFSNIYEDINSADADYELVVSDRCAMLASVLGVQHVKSNQRESVTPDVEEVGESDGYITTKKFKDNDKALWEK